MNWDQEGKQNDEGDVTLGGFIPTLTLNNDQMLSWKLWIWMEWSVFTVSGQRERVSCTALSAAPPLACDSVHTCMFNGSKALLKRRGNESRSERTAERSRTASGVCVCWLIMWIHQRVWRHRLSWQPLKSVIMSNVFLMYSAKKLETYYCLKCNFML